MTNPTAMTQLARRADRLVRSLVGILDISWAWNPSGRLQHVDILKDEAVEDHQLVRNVISGLGAGCGLKVERTAVRVHTDRAFFDRLRSSVSADAESTPKPAGPRASPEPASVDAHAPGECADSQDAPEPVQHRNGNGHKHAGHANGNGHANGHNGHGNGSGYANGHANGSGEKNGVPRSPAGSIERPELGGVQQRARPLPGAGRKAPVPPPDKVKANPAPAARSTGVERAAAPAAAAPQRPSRDKDAPSSRPVLDRIDVERRGASLRCRVELKFRGHRYSAIAEVPDGASAEAEVAARVTLDAMRGGALTRARLDGVGFVTIKNTTYVVATLRAADSSASRASAAPVVDSVAAAAVAAVLEGVGPIMAGAAKPVHAR